MKTNLMKKVLGFVLTLVMVCCMLPMTSNAAETTKVYLKPGTNWTSAGARIVMYAFNAVGNQWADFSDTDGDGVYVAEISFVPEAVIFLRYAAGTEGYSWDYESNGTGHIWNRTCNITWLGNENNCYTIPNDWWGHENGNEVDGVVTTWSQDAWSHEVHDFVDGICACGYEDGIGAKLAGYSLSVDGKIGVNFYMELDAAVVADASSKMQFTLPDGSTSDVLVSAAKTDTIGGKTYYVFTCKVAAKEMASDIKGKIVTSTGEGTEYTYTVRDYADALIAKNSSAEEVAFVKAMLNYGAASQKFFNFNASDLANKNSDSRTITAYTATDLVSYKPVITDDSSVLSNVKSNLVLESGTKLNVKFTAAADATITLNDNAVSATGTNYVISIDDLNATELDKVQTVKVNTATIACSPLSYCYSVLATSDDANLKEVVCALYDYNKAADAYIVTQ